MTTNTITWPFQSQDINDSKPDTTQLYDMIEQYFADGITITQEEMIQVQMESTMYDEVEYQDFIAIATELFGEQRAKQFTQADYNEWMNSDIEINEPLDNGLDY